MEKLKVGERTIIFLDQSYWMNLAEAKAGPWLELRAELKRSVASGRLLVPVTTPNLLELMKLTDLEQGAGCAALMNELSQNVVFHGQQARLGRELRFLIRNHRDRPTFRDTPWWFGFSMFPAMSGDPELVSHPSEKGREIASAIAPEVFETMWSEGIRRVEPALGGYPDWLRVLDEAYETKMASLRARLGQGAAKYADLFMEELIAVLNTSALDYGELRRDLGDEILASFFAKYRTDDEKRFFYAAGSRTLFAAAATHAAYVVGGKTYRRNDLYDLENLITAVSYANMAAVDKGMYHVAVSRKLGEIHGTTVVKKCEDLLEAVRDSDSPGR